MKQCWAKGEFNTWVCTLGSLPKAIVLAYTYLPGQSPKWRISKGSFLPYTKAQYKKEFDSYEDCALYAEGIVLGWLNSLVIAAPHIPMITKTIGGGRGYIQHTEKRLFGDIAKEFEPDKGTDDHLINN